MAVAGTLTISEPATAITDMLMAALAVCFALALRRSPARHARFWAAAFAFLAGTASTGGAFHGLQGSVPPIAADALWRASMVLAALMSFAVFRAAALQWIGRNRPAEWAASVKLAASLVAGALHPEFVVVIADLGCTLLFALGAGFAGRARNPRAFLLLVAGFVLFLCGATVQQARLSPNPAFNHNDLFHAIQILGNTCFFLSARLDASRSGAVS